jgi:hypothetical protein
VSRPLGLLPAFVPTASSVDFLRSVSEYAVRTSTAIQAATPLYPRGPRSGLGSVVPVPHRLSGPIRPTRRHSAISLRRSLYALPSLYVSRLGDPRLVPCFHCSFFLNMSPSATPGNPAAVCTQFLHRQRWPSSLQYRLGIPFLPANPFHAGGTFRSFTTVRFRYNLLICSPS